MPKPDEIRDASCPLLARFALSALAAALAATLGGCDDGGGDAGGDAGDTDTDTDTGSDPGETVTATVHLIDAVSGIAPPDATVAFDGEPVSFTDGAAAGPVAAGAPFELTAAAPGYRDTLLNGLAGDEDFHLTSFVSSRTTTAAVFGALGLTVDDTAGIVVVGVDTPALEPVVGATVSLDATHDAPFVFAGNTPTPGDTIPAGGASFVSFPNVEPGPVEIAVEPPAGLACHAFPGPGELSTIEAYADAVSVISYTCQ